MNSHTIRAATSGDVDDLWIALAHAAFEQSVDAAKADPFVASYLDDWPGQADYGFVARSGSGNLLGAVWTRTFGSCEPHQPDHRANVPEICIGVVPEQRGRGIGRQLLCHLTVEADKRRLSLRLSVRANNPAIHLYERMGFGKLERSETINRVGSVSISMLRRPEIRRPIFLTKAR